ncbi:hypothetical protein R3W88_033375 [Solanum pinnatisectum]|uniref:ATP synthase protein MI25 n=1 Tax=Solanum pinnatisectum TaxID=50273 RepID=A0AAV9K1J3_9SOLN|nr:hypothetical protein R3W88_033375 [Solanum pinnatisectum]
MRLSSMNMQARKMLFATILSICASSSKKISIYNEEMILALCFIGFIIFSRKSLVESLPMARCAPNCKKTVQDLLCRNLNDDIAIKMHILVGKRFCPQCSSKAERVEFI